MGRGTQLFVVGVLFLVACSSFRQLCASSSDDDDHTVNTLYYLCLSTTDYTRLEIILDLSDSDILFLDFRYFTTHSTTRSKAVGSFLTKKNIKVFTYPFFINNQIKCLFFLINYHNYNDGRKSSQICLL